MTRAGRAALALTLVLMAGAGCARPVGAGGVEPAGARPSGVASDATPAPPGVPQSLAFRGRTLDGAAFDAAALAGRPVVLWFWAPWCPTCAGQTGSVADVAAEYGDRIGVLGIAGLGDNAAMREFVTDFKVESVPHLDDQSGELWRRFGVAQQSVYVLIDRAGTVTHTGWLDDVEFTAKVRALVG